MMPDILETPGSHFPWENENFLICWKVVNQYRRRRRKLRQPVQSFEEFSDLPLLVMIAYKWELCSSCWLPISLHFPFISYFLYPRKTSLLAFSKVLCNLTPALAGTYCLHAWNAIPPLSLPSGPQSRVSSLVISLLADILPHTRGTVHCPLITLYGIIF